MALAAASGCRRLAAGAELGRAAVRGTGGSDESGKRGRGFGEAFYGRARGERGREGPLFGRRRGKVGKERERGIQNRIPPICGTHVSGKGGVLAATWVRGAGGVGTAAARAVLSGPKTNDSETDMFRLYQALDQ